ncbi:helix-turn-helix transcriptional regulator [Pectinatus sottacetonis]|uniref:helix-turn-helix transcriptional regulator n=1 Tax=Pectinatus sottacetonis TaxID=1002795 RepID=UPI0018C6F8FA
MEDLKQYITLVDFLGKSLGNRYEVVLHDLTVPEKSIIAIANGDISGRKIGGPITDLLLKILKKGKKEHITFITNYKGKTGNKTCRSSSYFIYDKTKKIIGVLCINVDITPLIDFKKIIDNEISFVNYEDKKTLKDDIMENLEGSVDDLIKNMITSRFEQYTNMGSQMSVDDRLNLVRDLYNDGFFLLRGSVSVLAEKLSISEPTLYRYLNRIKRHIEK